MDLEEPGLSLRLGNDIVDLEHRRCQNRLPEDPLFERILAGPERKWLGADVTDDLWPVRVWALWASKEAAFKVLCKLPGGLQAFHHRSFVCGLRVDEQEGSSTVRVEGVVQGPGESPPVWVEGISNFRYLHVVGWNGLKSRLERGRFEAGLEGVGGEESRGIAGLEHRFTPEEWQGVHSWPSARVRLLARERLGSHLRSSAPVEILTSGTRPGRTPPRVRVGGRDRPDLDISLSHHGQYVAWALFIPDFAEKRPELPEDRS